LECLASADRDGIRAEIIVVDNAGTDNTKEVAESFCDRIPLRYLYEPTSKVYGKSSALNRALASSALGAIVAVLDDDMSPNPNWFRAVTSIYNRWPDKDIFSGHTYIIWPYEEVPAWAKERKLCSWLFSAAGLDPTDTELADGRWYSGNHFWFRSRVLEGGRRFKDIWLTEPDFQLDLVEEGFRGVGSGEALVGHRIQPALLRPDLVLARAKKPAPAERGFVFSPIARESSMLGYFMNILCSVVCSAC
jgi:glycosyltransferase involved in cell wall biosynthesis